MVHRGAISVPEPDSADITALCGRINHSRILCQICAPGAPCTCLTLRNMHAPLRLLSPAAHSVLFAQQGLTCCYLALCDGPCQHLVSAVFGMPSRCRSEISIV